MQDASEDTEESSEETEETPEVPWIWFKRQFGIVCLVLNVAGNSWQVTSMWSPN